MQIIQLSHDGRLNYPSDKDLPQLHLKEFSLPDDSLVITFRANQNIKPDFIYKKWHACKRLLDFPKTSCVVFFGLEVDSPLAPLIFWDILPRLAVGTTIINIFPENHSYLERSYFSNSLSIQSRDSNKIILQKVAPLPVEADAGLERWSFCIPVGPEDAGGLNAVVKRILELNICEKEIILCGRPGANFKYWDKVRIVGEDIPAPPVRISLKKNTLVEAARYENVCILHDRVFLPKNFLEGMKKFGDLFPFTTLQSFYFASKNNLSYRRYSDYCQSKGTINLATIDSVPQSFDRSGKLSKFVPAGFSVLERLHYIAANPLRYQQNSFATGSLYICKRSTWLSCQQDPDLYWSEFEDVEQGHRASQMGIPMRINPFILSQCIFSRFIFLSSLGKHFFESIAGESKHLNMHGEGCIQNRKPLFRLSAETAHKRLLQFSKRYLTSDHREFLKSLLAKKPINASLWMTQAASVLALAQMKRDYKTIISYIQDVEKSVFHDQIPFSSIQYFVEQFQNHGKIAKINLFNDWWLWLGILYQCRPYQNIFYHSLKDYFVPKNMKTFFGTLISALSLASRNGQLFYHPDGFRGFLSAIKDSTPYQDYFEEDEENIS